ncbi:MAG: ATP-binding protein [Pseudomonadota bacterium]
MIRFKSIMSRIMFLHVIALVITAVLLPLLLYALVSSTATDLHRQTMRDHAESIARYLRTSPDGRWSLDLPPGLRDQFSEVYGRYSYAILDGEGRVLFSSRKDQAAVFPSDARMPGVEFLEMRSGSRFISGVSLRSDIDGRGVWIQVAEDFAHRDVVIDDIVADFFQRVGWITLPILLLLLATDIIIFRRALRPLMQASERAQNIGPARTDLRLPVDRIPQEIVPLVHAVNQALDRLDHGFRVQREFTADAAHELRTPLTVLRTRLDTLEDQRIARALQTDVEGMVHIVNQLLDIAELETFVVDPQEKADLHKVCAEVAEFIAPLALAQGKNIALLGAETPVWIKGNEEMLRRAVRNLVENAIRYTPQGTTVEIVVGDGGTLDVLDQGPGIAETDRELIFRRFWRGDRRRSGSAGLGLSIVRQIVESHSGTIAITTRPNGGAHFSLRFNRCDQ